MSALSVGSTFIVLFSVNNFGLFEVDGKWIADFSYGMKMWANWTEAYLKNKRGRLPKVKILTRLYVI